MNNREDQRIAGLAARLTLGVLPVDKYISKGEDEDPILRHRLAGPFEEQCSGVCHRDAQSRAVHWLAQVPAKASFALDVGRSAPRQTTGRS